MADRVFHVVGDHDGGQVIFVHQLVGQCQHLCGGGGIECGGVLVKQKQFRVFHGCHEQCHCLALTAREKPHFGSQAVFKPQIELREQFAVALTVTFFDCPNGFAAFAAAVRDRKVFLDPHIGGSPHHGILEYASDVLCTFIFRELGDVHIVDEHLPLVEREDARHSVEHGGFSCAVTADDGHEIAVVQRQVEVLQRDLFIDRAGVKYFGNVFQFKHLSSPPVSFSWRRRSF